MRSVFNACRESQPWNRGLACVFMFEVEELKEIAIKDHYGLTTPCTKNSYSNVFSLGMAGSAACILDLVPGQRCVFKKLQWLNTAYCAACKMSNCSRNTALQWWCAEAPGRKAQAIKWKIPAEDVFPFLIWRKRVLFEAGMSVENTENRRRWENDLIELGILSKHAVSANPTAFLLWRSQSGLTYMLCNCSPDPPIWHAP